MRVGLHIPDFTWDGGPAGLGVELIQVKATTPAPIGNDPDLLTQLPQLPLAVAALPEALQRGLHDAFQLQVRYYRPRHEVTIRVTIRADALPGLTRPRKGGGRPAQHLGQKWKS